jgi:hypothetical protein
MTAQSRAKKAAKHATLAARGKKPKHGASEHADKKASVVQEESTKPSRKSTRKSSNRGKPSTNLELRAQREARTPKRRAATATRKAKRVGGRPSR